MNTDDFARRIIDRLEVSNVTGWAVYPWILVGERIISPFELVNMTDSEISNNPEWQDGIEPVCDMIWSMRGYARPSYTHPKTFATPSWFGSTVTPAIILFWPPRKEGYAPEFVLGYGSDEDIMRGVEFLKVCALPIYNGARRVLWRYHPEAALEPDAIW